MTHEWEKQVDHFIENLPIQEFRGGYRAPEFTLFSLKQKRESERERERERERETGREGGRERGREREDNDDKDLSPLSILICQLDFWIQISKILALSQQKSMRNKKNARTSFLSISHLWQGARSQTNMYFLELGNTKHCTETARVRWKYCAAHTINKYNSVTSVNYNENMEIKIHTYLESTTSPCASSGTTRMGDVDSGISRNTA